MDERKLLHNYKQVIMLTFCLLLSGNLYAQQATVTGTVMDAQSQESLPGVNIAVSGTSTGTSTNTQGMFSLQVTSLSDTLIFSFIGYQTLEIPIRGRSEITVTMTPRLLVGEEVVVVGYGTQKRRDISSSVTTVDSENFNRGVVLSPEHLIQGRMAGVNISQNSGKPGGSNTVRIRGGTSITASNEPLYVIDGVPIQTSGSRRQNDPAQMGESRVFDQEPVNPLNAINPSDIESITVLKDASATAIYGSRGANGVIVVTTKDGVAGGTQVGYNTSIGFSTAANRIDVLNADEFRQANQDLGLEYTDLGGDVDYQDLVLRKGFSQNHNISLSGGTEYSQYRGSIGYTQQEGILRGSNHENFNARLNINHSALDDKLNISIRLNAAQFKDDQAPTSNTVGGESGTNLLWDTYRFNPTMPVYNSDGEFNHIDQFNVNPLSYERDMIDERATRRFLGSMQASYQILDQLSADINLSHTIQDIDRDTYLARRNPIGDGFGGMATLIQVKDWSNLLESTLRYTSDLSENSSVEAVGGYSWQEFTEVGSNFGFSGFLSDEFSFNSIQAASTVENRSNFRQVNRLISWFGRVNYNFSDKYLVSASLRRDGSSRFGVGNKWGWFPSGSVAWRISEEEFFNVGLINHMQFRGSYGITGNQEIGNLNSVQTLGASSSGYLIGGNRITIVLPQQFANPNLKWEETSQLNIGLDLEFFDGRFGLKTDYYKKTTNDLLLSFSVPSPSVVSSQLANVGSVENEGFEIELNTRLVQKTDLTWLFDLNLSHNRNEVISLSDDQYGVEEIHTTGVPGAGLTGVDSQIIKPGYGVGTFYGPEFLGFDEEGRQQLSEDDRILGKASPDFTLGIGNSVFYKSWDLRFNFRGSIGNEVLNVTALNLGSMTQLPSNNILQESIEVGANRDENKEFSSRYLEDGSYLRLDNVTLGHTFDTTSLEFLRNARVYVSGQNLFVLTGYSGLDPEVNSDVSGSGTAPLGVDYLSFPRARTFTVGASISF